MIKVSSISALRALAVAHLSPGLQARASGYYSSGDGGEGIFTYDAASLAADDGGTVITPNSGTGRWVRVVGPIIAPEMFGMRGDGSTDDFPAWVKLIAWLNTQGSGRIKMMKGKTYYFDRYITSGGDVENPIFRSLVGLVIDGHGATIKVKGGFTRSVKTTNTLCGLVLYDCSQVTIANLILDGNSSTITKSGSPSEGFVYGLYFASCTKVKVENVVTKYWITDGIAFNISNVSNPCRACRDVQMRNVESIYNARQGMSIIQLYGGLFENCNFSFTGKSSYGGHSPQAGVDIEQDRLTDSASPNQMDVNTGELVFKRCRFYFNSGCTMVSSSPAYTMGITLERCRLEVGAGNIVSSAGFINDARNVTIRDSYFDMADRGAYFTFTAGSLGYVNLFGNTIKGQQELIRALQNTPMRVEYNRFIATWVAPNKIKAIYINNPGCVFRNNYVFLPKEGYISDGAGGRATRISLANCLICEENEYETNLLASAWGGGGTAHYATSYTEGNVSRVRNETYTGTSHATTDTIRPVYN